MDWKVAAKIGATLDAERDAGIAPTGIAPNRSRKFESESWVDAVVTLLATMIFGLGWVWVEVERADPPGNRYDHVRSEQWAEAFATSRPARASELGASRVEGGSQRWIRGAPKRLKP